MANRQYKAISIFSGAMGLDIGLEKTGRFNFLACVEKEPSFCNTIRINKNAGRLSKDLRIYQGDICDIPPEQIMQECNLVAGELDLLVGGPPCQAFSTAGKRATVQDPRGTLIWQFLKYIKIFQPKFFVMENVRGLTSAALVHRPIAVRPKNGGPPLTKEEMPGSVIRMLANDLKTCGKASYHMDCFEVNAVNYGAPQLRERLIFVGNRFNKRLDFPDPTHGNKDSALLSWRTLGDVIGDITDPGEVLMDFSPRKKYFLNMIPQGANWRSLPIEVQQESMGKAWLAKGGRSGWWRRLSFDLPCPTLVTMPNHASTSLCHPIEVRSLSLKEYALIQEFPQDWKFSGSPIQQYTQVGNAVPVRLGYVTGEVVAHSMDELVQRQWTPEVTNVDEFRIVYIQSHVRTRQWYKNGEVKIWKHGEANKSISYGTSVTLRGERSMAGRK